MKLISALLENPDGMPYLPEWSEEGHLEMMHKQNIKRSILSISSPGTHLIAGDHKLASRITRECNAYAADLKKRRPGQFGYFASLPIPFVDICLQEIETASKEGCDGFIMMTNGFGVYPGNAVLDPVFEELNRRMATVFFHPTRPICPCSPEALANGQQPTKATPFAGQYPDPMLEFMFDTARTVANLFLCGTIRRSPKIQFIFPHCVGALPPLLPRFTAYSSLVPGPWTGVSEDEAREAFQKQIWVDLAGVSFPYQVKGLMATIGVPHHRLFYGSVGIPHGEFSTMKITT